MQDTIQAHIKLLEKKFPRDGRFSLQDASSATGASLSEARKSLDQLMIKYNCSLKLTENGDLLYDFGKRRTRRGKKTKAERMAELKEAIWKVFKVVFKTWIAITLVVYFVLFLVIMVAMLVAMLSQANDKKGGKGGNIGGNLFKGLGDLFGSLWRWDTVTRTIIYDRDKRRYPYQEYEPRKPEFDKYRDEKKKKKKSKSFIAAVYDFVFGPPRVDIHTLRNQQEVAAFLRKQKGIIVKSEMKGLAGWNSDEVEQFFADCIIRFDGSAEITENGILYGDFPDINRSVSKEEDAEIIWFWEEYVPDFKLNGNSIGLNTGIVCMNLFNLVFAFMMLAYVMGSPEVQNMNLDPALLAIFLGVIPLTFSFLFFIIPIFRYFQNIPRKKARHIQNIRKRLTKVIYEDHRKVVPQDHLITAANRREKGEEMLSKRMVEKTMNTFLEDWNGYEENVSGRISYRFDEFEHERKEAEQIRYKRTQDKDWGHVVIETET